MKKYFLFLFFYCIGLNAQIINFPDANFKAKLLQADVNNSIANYLKIDTNNNGEIEVSEAQVINTLHIDNSSIISLTGINYFSDLVNLDCSSNLITNLDCTSFVNLYGLYCQNNQLTSLNVGGLSNLYHLYCSNNQLATINVSDLNNLGKLDCSHNQLTNLDLLSNIRLYVLDCSYNLLTNLELNDSGIVESLNCRNNILNTMTIKGFNRTYINGMGDINFNNNSNLEYICARNSDVVYMQNLANAYGYTNCHVNSYCSFTPGGTFYTIQGNNKYDANTNGCDVLDHAVPNLKFNISDGTIAETLVSNTLGIYSVAVQDGTHTLTPVLENPTYFNILPTSINVTFPLQISPLIQNFCITPNGVHSDVEVVLLKYSIAIPGFDATYKIIYKNKGNQLENGSINLTFDDAVLDYVSSIPLYQSSSTNQFTWNYTNLQPFETREIILTLNLNSPMETPAVNNGDVLNYTATITSVATDEMPSDNTFTLNQTVLNSYDPNDKTCLEGATIPPTKVGDYVHYMIRFENNGTANAQNIVVKDMIDLVKFDINSLVPMKGSHSFVTNITQGNKVEFIFENINLPFDDANNDGYVAFKIKTKPTLVLGNTFSNSASIYFDYNFPIVTNTATTTIAALSTKDFEFNSYFSLYPNPVSDVLNITANESIKISSINIYNTLGQLVLVIPNAEEIKTVDVSSLTSGNYFIKIYSDKGTSNTKFIKQ